MRQIGPRDVAKMLGGMGACGLETRCCSKFLTDFSPISIKMAKDQNLSLNPPKISGLCGRLMCCLSYEHKHYKEMNRGLPREGERIELRAVRRADAVEHPGRGDLLGQRPQLSRPFLGFARAVLRHGHQGRAVAHRRSRRR